MPALKDEDIKQKTAALIKTEENETYHRKYRGVRKKA